MNLTKLDSVYQFLLSLPQAATETILENKLNKLAHFVERSRELTDVKVNYSDIEVEITHADGVREMIRCHFFNGMRWGAQHCTQDLWFQFPGDDLPEQFVVADGELDSFLPRDHIHLFSATVICLVYFH